MSSVKVAVRVRPFNSRELLKKSRCIIKMQDKVTGNLMTLIYCFMAVLRKSLNLSSFIRLFQSAIEDLRIGHEGTKTFTFDYSYWSHGTVSCFFFGS